MSDITMCSGEGCPLKEKCHRFTAVKNLDRQSFFVKPPFEIDKKKFTCKMFWGESYELLLQQIKTIIGDKKTKGTNSGIKRTKPTGGTGRKN
jgi:hypothetical protein